MINTKKAMQSKNRFLSASVAFTLLKNKKAITPILAVVILFIITVSVSGGAFFWLSNIQGQIEEEENLEVRTLGTEASEVDLYFCKILVIQLFL
jgi:flagellin-like protein